MLGTDGSNRSDGRFYKLHQIGNITDMVRAHLTYKHLMNRFHHLTDRPCDSHRGIVAGRCDQCIELLGKHRIHDVLGCRLSVGSGNADTDHVIMLGKDPFGIVDKALVDPFLNRSGNQCHRIDQQPRPEIGKRQHQPQIKPAVTEQQPELYQKIQYRKHRDLTFDTVAEYKRFDIGCLRLPQDQNNRKHGSDHNTEQQDMIHRQTHTRNRNCRDDRSRNDCTFCAALYVFHNPGRKPSEFVTVLLEHMERMLGRHQRRKNNDYKIDNSHNMSSFKNASSTRLNRSA